MTVLPQDLEPVHAELNVGLWSLILELKLGNLELGVPVVEEVRRVSEIGERELGVRLQSDVGQPDADVAGNGRERLADVGSAGILFRIGVDMLIGNAVKQPVGLGVVSVRAGVVGVDPRQIVLRYELALGRGELERRNCDLVVAAVVGADTLASSAELKGVEPATTNVAGSASRTIAKASLGMRIAKP